MCGPEVYYVGGACFALGALIGLWLSYSLLAAHYNRAIDRLTREFRARLRAASTRRHVIDSIDRTRKRLPSPPKLRGPSRYARTPGGTMHVLHDVPTIKLIPIKRS